MTKELQFIMMVQTAIITKYACDPGDGSSPMSRPMWSIEHMAEAFILSERIPAGITAANAAYTCVRWMFSEPTEGNDDLILKEMIGDGI